MGNVDCRKILKGNPKRNSINYNFSLDTNNNLNINLNNINSPQEEKKVMNSPSPIILNNSNVFYNNSCFSQENVISSKEINSISSKSFESEEFKKFLEENIGGIKVSKINKVVNNDIDNEKIVCKEKRKSNLNDKDDKKEIVNEIEKGNISLNNKENKIENKKENENKNKNEKKINNEMKNVKQKKNKKEKKKDNENDDNKDNNNQSHNIRRKSTFLNFEHRRMPIEIIDEKRISKIRNSLTTEQKQIEINNNNNDDYNLKINNNNNIYLNINTNQLQNFNIPNNNISNNYIPYNNILNNNMPNYINPNNIECNNIIQNNNIQTFNNIIPNNNIQNYNYFIQNNFTNLNIPQNIINNNIINTNPQQISKTNRNPEKNKKTIKKKKNNENIHWKNLNIINIIPLEKRTKVYDNTILLNANFHVFSRETLQNKKLETTLRFIILTRSELKIYRSIEAKLFQKNPLRTISLFNISKCDLFSNNSEINNKNLEFYYNFFIQFITVNKMVNNDDTYIHHEKCYKHNNINYKLIHDNNINSPKRKRKKISYLSGNSDNCKYKTFQIKGSNNFDNNSETLVFSCEDEKLINEWINVINYFIN